MEHIARHYMSLKPIKSFPGLVTLRNWSPRIFELISRRFFCNARRVDVGTKAPGKQWHRRKDVGKPITGCLVQFKDIFEEQDFYSLQMLENLYYERPPH